jgi:hypothetical protein
MNREPGTFSNHANGVKYIALSRAARAVGIPAHEITDAVSQGRLPVVEVSGCKCIAVTDLFRFKDEGGESWKA